MSVSSTASVPLIPVGESSQRANNFMIELVRGQALSPAFMNPDIIAGVKRENISAKGANMQLPREMPEPQCDISCPSVASQVVGKMQRFNTFSGDCIQKGEVLFEQRAFEVKSVMQSHTEVTLREEIVQSLGGAVADLV